MPKKILFALCLSFSILSVAGCASFNNGNHGNRTKSTTGTDGSRSGEQGSDEIQTGAGQSGSTKENADQRETNQSNGSQDNGSQGNGSQKNPSVADLGGSATASDSLGQMNTGFMPGFNKTGDQYKPLTVKANAPRYQLNKDLSNIDNMGQFSNLTQKQRDMIGSNGFVVIPTKSEQLFYIYEENTYKKVPNFVTTDSVLQLYHILYDYSLRNLETKYFYNDLILLNNSMLKQLTAEYEVAKNEKVKESAYKMMGYFGVSSLALGKGLPADFPAGLKEPVNKEYDLITKAEGKSKSPLFGYTIDYSLFKVRGHYTRSEELGKFFRAMSWYGVIPMPFYTQSGERDEASAMRAIVTTIALSTAPKDEGVKLWENIYSTTSFYVGESDDITPYEVAKAIQKVYSDRPDIDQIPDKLDAFYVEVENMKKPEIVSKTKEDVTQPQLRFMGQRYIPDSEILQNLSDPDYRPFPTGLDVFAVFGSERAKELLTDIYKPASNWDGYQRNFDILKDEFRNQSVKDQTANLYTGWLYCLKGLNGAVDDGVPFFMKNNAWKDKSLSTALGSWSEIRHDTILYGKQSAAECGGGDEPPDIVGYVEPNPEFFNRLLWLATTTKVNLASRGFLSDDMKGTLESFEEMLGFLKTCAQKELTGEDLTPEEHYTLLTYGGTLEYLSSSIADASNWFLVESETDKNMASIADVHTSASRYLEEGVGTAAEMYVAVPQNGKIYLARGSVFDYYEFVSDQRLTDEAWQERIKKAPQERPPFTKSYMDETEGIEIPVPNEPYSTGC